MRLENCFKAGSCILKVAVLAVLCTLAVGCSKEDKLEIPDSLRESVWTMWTEDGSKELAFHFLFECTLTEKPLDGTPVEYRYIYKYNKPNLELRPYDEGRGEELKGSIFRWDDHSIGMSLYTSADNTLVFSSSKSDGHTVWADL